MNLFEFLILGHLTGDFLFQTSWMAREKTIKITALILHSAVYTFFIGVAAALAGRYSLPALLIVFLSHMFLDNRRFVNFWAEKINGASDLDWMKIIIDQCWHLIVLGAVLYLF